MNCSGISDCRSLAVVALLIVMLAFPFGCATSTSSGATE